MAKEFTRVVCPCCGMMPTLKNLEQTAKEKPAQVRIFIQRIGGKLPTQGSVEGVPYKKKGRGSAPGFIEYEDITEQVPEQVGQLKKFFDERIKLYQEGD